MSPASSLPVDFGEVVDLKPQSSGEIAVTADTTVVCINRGREPLYDTFNSRHYEIPVGLFSVVLGAAKHFQARAVVPGSRNPETGFQASFISILGVVVGNKVVHPIDDAVQWAPFTDDECREYGHAVEALDRASMVDPIESDVDIVPTRGQRNADAVAAGKSRLKGGSGSRGRTTSISGPGADLLKPGNTAPNEAMRQIRADTARQAGGQDAED